MSMCVCLDVSMCLPGVARQQSGNHEYTMYICLGVLVCLSGVARFFFTCLPDLKLCQSICLGVSFDVFAWWKAYQRDPVEECDSL